MARYLLLPAAPNSEKTCVERACRCGEQGADMSGTAIMKLLLQGLKNEPGMCCSAHPPTQNAAGEGVDDNGHVDEALLRSIQVRCSDWHPRIVACRLIDFMSRTECKWRRRSLNASIHGPPVASHQERYQLKRDTSRLRGDLSRLWVRKIWPHPTLGSVLVIGG